MSWIDHVFEDVASMSPDDAVNVLGHVSEIHQLEATGVSSQNAHKVEEALRCVPFRDQLIGALLLPIEELRDEGFIVRDFFLMPDVALDPMRAENRAAILDFLGRVRESTHPDDTPELSAVLAYDAWAVGDPERALDFLDEGWAIDTDLGQLVGLAAMRGLESRVNAVPGQVARFDKQRAVAGMQVPVPDSRSGYRGGETPKFGFDGPPRPGADKVKMEGRPIHTMTVRHPSQTR